MLNVEGQAQFQLEYMAILPTGVSFQQGLQNFCQIFILTLEESDGVYATASGDDFGLRAKFVSATGIGDSRTMFIEITTKDAYSLQNARELIEERSNQTTAQIVLLRDSEGERRTLEAYRLLNELENMLRKLVAIRSATLSGERWWDERVLKCLKQNRGNYPYAERMTEEINDPDITQQRRQDHHAVFYLDLLDLKRIIEDADNWCEGFSSDLKVQRNLERLEMFNRLRRKIAHNRFLSQRNLDDLHQIHDQIMYLCRRLFNM